MRKGWEIKKLGDLTEVITKGTTPTSVGFNFEDEGVNFVKIESITSNGNFLVNKFAHISDKANEALKRSQLKEGDILFSIAGALGRTALVSKDILPANTNQALSIIRLKVDENVLKEYILSALTSGYALEQIEKFKGGVAQQNLSLEQMKNFQIPIPPLREQQQIVAILDQAFEAIDQAKANIEKNIANAKELFQSKLNAIFSQKGDGWEEKSLEELGTLTSSKRIYKKEYVANGIPFYRSKEIKELAHDKEITLELFIKEERYKEIKSQFGIPQEGDILLTAVGTIGEMHVVRKNEPEFYFKDGNIMWLKNFSTLNSYYLKYALLCYVEQLKAMSQGSAYSALTIEKLKKYSISVPSISEQEKIVKQLDELVKYQRKVTKTYKDKLNNLEDLKKSVLQKAFSGALTSPERTQYSKDGRSPSDETQTNKNPERVT